ncbi:OmpA/MotB family protein [Nesterenkonia halotolerans]|uniref:Chemotaxis protein MotB n=1 Tax=Nesterenkonia halotolerans TaxID=225325 RepID=A0ABR9J5Y0_9MICC|nr:flagellar motor protein MotB [Nesterenkonia halotolerans]MBE1514398.1 chemotaxis protein MotB [Nesterenkonia halotolerans]
MSSHGSPIRRSSTAHGQGGTARGSRRRGRGSSASGGSGHGGGEERWMASYMDMVTVLMCLFIVLYAMSTVDQDKYEQLRDSLATGFGTETSETVDTASGVVVPPALVDQEGPSSELSQAEQGLIEDATEDRVALAQAEIEDLRELQRELEQRLDEAGHEGSAEFVLDERGLTVRLVGAETFFDPNSSTLNEEGQEVIDAIAPVLAPTPRFFEVGGHADVRRPVEPYPTNWELSASRATGVLRELVEVGGVDASKIISVGYGDAHPVDDRLWLNRRVDVTVLSDEPEQIRELLPGLAEGAEEA